jgi:multidrug efflux pump subunit AcrB
MAELAHEVRTITDAIDAVIGQADVGTQVTDSFVNMAYTMLVATGLIYVLLVAPVIFFMLPLVVIGGFVSLAIISRALDLSALIVLLMLRGIVVTNTIVLRDLAVVSNASRPAAPAATGACSTHGGVRGPNPAGRRARAASRWPRR